MKLNKKDILEKLIGFYDKRTLLFTHKSSKKVRFKIEADPIGDGQWMTYREVTVNPGETFNLIFPDSFQSRWIRFISDRDCSATAILKYQ